MIPRLDCAAAAMIVRADIARFANDPQPAELVARAQAISEAHYHGYCPCRGWKPCAEMTQPASPEAVAAVAARVEVTR